MKTTILLLVICVAFATATNTNCDSKKMSKGLKHLDEEFNKRVDRQQQGSSGLQFWIEHFDELPKLDQPDECPDDWPGFIDQMSETLNLTLSNLKDYLEKAGEDKTEIMKKCKSFKSEIFKFIRNTMYPYDKCLVEERINNYTKIIDQLEIEGKPKKEMKDGLGQAKKIVHKLHQYNDETQQQLVNDARQMKQALEKVEQVKSKVEQSMESNQGQEEYSKLQKLQKIFTLNLNQYANRFFSTSYAIRKWDEKDEPLTKEEYDEFYNIM